MMKIYATTRTINTDEWMSTRIHDKTQLHLVISILHA